MTQQEHLIDSGFGLKENTDGFLVETYQHLPQEYLDGLKRERFENSQQRTPDGYYRAASIPVAVIDKWLRSGFDFWNASGPAIIARLKNEHLDAFITSDKAF